MKNRWLYAVLVVVLLIGALSGCASNPSPSPGYEILTLNEGVGHFSFEYPSTYKVEKVEIREDIGYTDIVLFGPYLQELKDFTFVSLTVMNTTEVLSDLETEINESLTVGGLNPLPEFMERSSIKINDISGQLVVYRRDKMGPDYTMVPTIWREVFFLYKGKWNITMRSNAATAEADKADLEHILQTFKILK